MLRLIQAEFLKLRRKKFIVLMLLSALFMPLLAVFYFRSADKTVIEPLQFYKWTTFSYTAWIILPVVLGLVSTMLMYDENQNDMLKQLWIIPISKTGYFFSKFIVVLSYSVCFMLLTAIASVFFGMLPGYITFFVLPAVIALLGSYMICREEQEDTIKSLRLIPISEAKMTIAKLLITFAFSVLFYLLLFGITFLVEVILHFRGLSIKMILSFFKIYLLDGIGIFFAIAPVIAVVSRIKKGYWLALIFTVIYSFAGLFTSISDVLSACYPITATFNISGYYSATFGEIIISLMSLFFCGLFSVLILISKKTIKNK